MKIDRIDKIIISMYAQDPAISQEDIAREAGLSQPSVAARVKKLKEASALVTHTGINPLKMGLFVTKVDITTDDPITILELFKNCPYFINGFRVSGKRNLCIFLMSDNIKSLESIVNHHIRSLDSVNDITFNLIMDAKKDLILPVMFKQKKFDNPADNDKNICKDCPFLFAVQCMGCPATGMIKNWLL